MQDKDQNNIFSLDNSGQRVQPDVVHHPPPLDGVPLDQTNGQPFSSQERAPRAIRPFRRIFLSRYTVIASLLLITGAAAFWVANNREEPQGAAQLSAANRFESTQIPLDGLLEGKDLSPAANSKVTINGVLQVTGSIQLGPSVQPTGALPGQLYYDQQLNQLAYYNGSNFVFLTGQPAGGVQSLGGATGQLVLGPGLSITNNTLTNSGVISVQGQSGAVTFTPGAGMLINGTTFSNNGVISITSANPNLVVTDDGNGNITLSVTGGTGSVTSGGGTAGSIPVFTASQNIENSIISQAGLAVTVAGDLSVTGNVSLTNALSVANGGTGSTSLTSNGVLVGQGTSAITSVTAAGAGLCLLSTVGAPAWGVCPGGGGGVTSLDGLSGALTIANSSGAGSTVTIDNASTSAKGIASFNASNFSVASGAVNTIQDIGTGATPTFAGVNTNTITPSSALTIGATGQSLLLQGNASTMLTAISGGNATTISFQSPTANVTYRFTTAAAGTYDVCTTAANCAGVGGGVTTPGGTTNRLAKFGSSQAITDSSITDDGTNVTTSIDMVIQGGDLTVGVPSSQVGAINLAHSGSAFLGSILQGPLSANRTYTLPDASGTFCLSSGNCAGGVTSLNGLVGALSIANASAAGSTITIDDATTAAKGIASFNSTNFSVSSGAVNTIQNIHTGATPTFAGVNTNTITPSGAMTIGATGQSLLLQGNASTTLTANNGGNATTLSFQSPAANVTYRFLTTAAGTYDICTTAANCAGVGGGVTTSGGTTNRLAKFSGGQTIANSSITDDGSNVLTSIDLVIQGGDLTVGVPTTQTGTINLAHSGSAFLGSILQGALSANRSYTLPDASGTICLSSGNCASVTSLNGLVGALSIANASAAGSTITIDDASTSAKGIASFNSTNFSVSSGAVNTIQNIHTGATPTFAGVNTNTITPSGAMTVGSTSQTALLRGSITTITSSGAGNDIILTSADSIELQGATNVTGNIDVSGTLTAGTANAFQVAASGDITTAGNATVQGGTVTAGTSSQAGSFVISDGSSNTGTLTVAPLGQNTTYTLPDPGAASATICLTSGNCAGTGGGVTTAGGTTNRLAKFSGAQSIADSTITDNGTTVTTTVDLVIQGGDVTVGTSSQLASLLLHDGNGQTTTIQAGDSSGSLTFILPTSAGSANQCLKQSGSGNQLVWDACDGGGGGSSGTLQTAYNNGNSINTTDNRDIDIVLADSVTTDSNFDLVVADGSTGFVSFARANGAGTADPAQLLLINNLDADRALPIGIKLQAAGGGMTTAIDATDAEIVDAINVAANNIVGTTGNIDFTNFDVAGSSGDITTAGNLAVNGGSITSTGGLTLTSGGGGNITLNAAGTIELQDNTNVTGNADISGTLTTGTANAFQVAASGDITSAGSATLQGGVVTIGTTSQAGSLVLSDGSSNTGTLQVAALGSNRVYTLPDATGTICLSTGNCASASTTLQGAYDNSTSPEIVVDATRGALTIRDSSGGIGANLLEIQNNAGSTTYLAVTTAGISVTGTTTSTGNINSSGGSLLTNSTVRIDNSGNATNIGNITLSGSISGGTTYSGSGNINTTGGALQTNSTTRIDNSGNLTNIGNLTGAGAITIASSGAGNDVIINGADIFDVQDATTFASTIGVNGVATFSNTLTANADVTIGDANTDLLTITSVLQGGSPLVFEGAAADASELTLSIASLTGDRTITLPDETGTVCLQSSTNCGFALSSGSNSYIQNQNSIDQTADFRISGTGQASSFVATSLDTASATTLTIAGTNANIINVANNASAHVVQIATSSGAAQTVTVGSTNSGSTTAIQGGTGSSAVSIQGGSGGTITIGTTSSNVITVGNTTTTATLTLGQSTASNTINIGNATTAAGNTQTINIGTSATSTGKATITIGNTNDGSALNLQAGTGNVNLITNASTASVIAKSSTDSTVAFQVQNSTSASLLTVDTSGSNIQLLGNNSPTLATWTTTTAMSVGANTARARGSAIAANGYLYYIGGHDGTGSTALTTVEYAKLNADGTVGTWASTTVLPAARKQFQAVAVNGYLYVIGGRNDSNVIQSTSYYAKLNPDGTVGTWNTTTALSTGAASRFAHGAVAYNGYIYILGGFDSGVTSQSTVYYIKVNPDGTLASTWSTTTAMPVGLSSIDHAIVVNGYVYIVGGFTNTYEDDIYYAKLNTDGTAGSWTTVSSALNASGGGDENLQTFVANGYLYAVGGDLNDRVAAFQLNSDGSLSAGTNLTDFPLNPVGEAGGASANGYFYILGGSTSADGAGTVRNTVYYTSSSRVKVGGNLDLVGYSGENLAEGRSGGALTAGNTTIVGTLQVQDVARFTQGVSIDGTLKTNGPVAFQSDTSVTTDTATITPTNTSGTQTNALLVNRNGTSGTTTNGINITNTAGTLTNGLAFTGTIGTDITRSSGTLSIQGAGGIALTSSSGNIVLGASDATGTLLVLDGYTQSSEPSGTNGAMYYNSALHQYRCYRASNSTAADGAWEPCGINPIDRGWMVEDEFLGGAGVGGLIGELGWEEVETGVSSFDYNVGGLAPTANHPGMFEITTGATSGNGSTLYLNGSSTGGAAAIISAGNVVKTTVGMDTTLSNAILRVGLHTETTSSTRPVSGVWWEAAPTVNAKWQYCYGNGTTATCAAASSNANIAATTWYRLEIRVTATGTNTSSAEFFLDGTKYTVSGVTIDSTNRVNPALSCFTSTAAARDCDIDYFQYRGVSSAAR